MNISGIRPYMGFYDQNFIRIRPDLPIHEASPVSESEKTSPAKPEISEEEILEARAGQTFGAYDYASQYKPGQVYSMKGEDSDLNSLDVIKAVSDMEKDVAIQQYQFFVSDKKTPSVTSSKPVADLENFAL
ncbi:MAG: hypothetical protein K5773_10035 [Pseudobutyrivibrio sp.]|nr:hypothetical protein [Pseudobutyrivibrio sp.]